MKRPITLFACTFLLFFLLTACGVGGSTTTTNTHQVDITETEFAITSSVTRFAPGTTYHFVVTNAGETAHECMILPKSEGSMSGLPMGNMDAIALASISNLGPGETKTLDCASATGSHPEFACYVPGHYEAGMKQAVGVNPE